MAEELARVIDGMRRQHWKPWVEGEDLRWERESPESLLPEYLPPFASTPSDEELVKHLLRPACQSPPERRRLHAAVNARVPFHNPWELPGMAREEGKRGKYFFVDRGGEFNDLFYEDLAAQEGTWKSRGLGFAIRDDDDSTGLRFRGIKRTYDFLVGPARNKTNWIMNAYYFIDNSHIMQSEVVLCHIFEEGSNYNARPKCAAFHQPHVRQEYEEGFCVENYGEILESMGVAHNYKQCSAQYSDQMVISKMAEFEKLVMTDTEPCCTNGYDWFRDPSATSDSWHQLGNPETSMDVEYGQLRKRKKACEVWERFTKFFARGTQGEMLTFAACNHCSIIMKANSKNGTSSLRKHRCPCPCRPQPLAVAAGKGKHATQRDAGYVGRGLPEAPASPRFRATDPLEPTQSWAHVTVTTAAVDKADRVPPVGEKEEKEE